MKNPATTGAAPTGAVAARDESTRDRVARSIQTNGPSSAAVLAERLELTPAAVRRHLDHLLEDGLVESREERVYGPRGRGRPAKVFVLTDTGRHAFHQAYDDLAATALKFIAESGGDEAVAEFARGRVAEVEQRYRELVDAAPDSDKAEALARALTTDGYAASTAKAAHGEQLCQHHCPVAHVAEQFPQLCEAETEVFSRLLGRHVQRLATIAHGDGVCTTHIPGHVPAPQAVSGPAPVTDGESARTAR
ncbi:transcriptional regulator [Kribbella capetownensis]|uniref:Transcriptional regulator n=1 Tax=Kribbella capetownensis TaxID=1572659 RepID=A0A4V2M806_9ACTN|nr:metalloregulator ArsR/SmtB family transcription factor [Kribbella capetownensis]TCC49662.1 transcriptional regulator [Kribbella capetownensis]